MTQQSDAYRADVKAQHEAFDKGWDGEGYQGRHRRGDGQLFPGMVVWTGWGFDRVDKHGHWTAVES